MNRILTYAAFTMFLSACTTMSPDECRVANWQQIGYRDGQNGSDPSIIQRYSKDCADAGVAADSDLWRKGFKQGTVLYCSPDNGYRVGKQGRNTTVFVRANNFSVTTSWVGKSISFSSELRRLTDKLTTSIGN